MNSDLVETIFSIDWKTHALTWFVFGIILSTLANPIIGPWSQDLLVTTPLIGTPVPEVEYQYRNTSSTGYISSQVDVDLTEARYRTFFVKISNPTQKVIQDFNLALFFHGCPLRVGVQYTNLDAAIVSRQSDELQADRVANFIEHGCGASITIEELPPGRWSRIFIVVDTRQLPSDVSEDALIDEFEVRRFIQYQWELNGRQYYEDPDPKTITVDDRVSLGELVAV